MKTRPCSSPGSAHHSRCASRVSRDPSHPASVSLKRPSNVPCRSVPELPAVLWLPPTCNPHICALEQLFQSKASWKEGRESSACEIKGSALPPDYWRGRAYPRTIKAEVHLTGGHLSQERTTEGPIPWPRWRPYTHLWFFSLVPPTHCNIRYLNIRYHKHTQRRSPEASSTIHPRIFKLPAFLSHRTTNSLRDQFPAVLSRGTQLC